MKYNLSFQDSNKRNAIICSIKLSPIFAHLTCCPRENGVRIGNATMQDLHNLLRIVDGDCTVE